MGRGLMASLIIDRTGAFLYGGTIMVCHLVWLCVKACKTKYPDYLNGYSHKLN